MNTVEAQFAEMTISDALGEVGPYSAWGFIYHPTPIGYFAVDGRPNAAAFSVKYECVFGKPFAEGLKHYVDGLKYVLDDSYSYVRVFVEPVTLCIALIVILVDSDD